MGVVVPKDLVRGRAGVGAYVGGVRLGVGVGVGFMFYLVATSARVGQHVLDRAQRRRQLAGCSQVVAEAGAGLWSRAPR